ncbi:MAG: SDR family oxidoreductase, partial [Candidatus Omnitrophota bacterium]
ITGGTSRLGQAFVRKAAGQGARVFFTYFRSLETAQELEKGGAKGFLLDLANSRDIDAFAEAFKGENEQLDVLIHNAAATADALIEKMSEKEWDDVLRVNLKAPFYLTQKLLPLLLMKKPSKVFTLVSRAGLSGLAGAANYAASKGGLIAMTKTLARELGRKKILVNAINPGFMRSAMTADVPQDVLQRSLEDSPLKTFSDPEEVADFLLFLSSDQVRQVTGQVVHFESRPF